jgi:hypothetical protein
MILQLFYKNMLACDGQFYLEKIEKVNAPPPQPSIAFSLTKTGGRI